MEETIYVYYNQHEIVLVKNGEVIDVAFSLPELKEKIDKIRKSNPRVNIVDKF